MDPDFFADPDFKTQGFKIRVLDVLHVRKEHIFFFLSPVHVKVEYS